MTPKEITSVAIKAFAIYVLVNVLLAVPTLASSLLHYPFYESGEPNSVLFLLLGFSSVTGVIVLVIILWKLANSIVEKADTPEDAADGHSVTQDFLVSLLGFYLVLMGSLQLGSVSFSTYMITQEGTELPASQLSIILVKLMQTVVGFSLILKAKGWASVLNRLRSVGLKGKM